MAATIFKSKLGFILLFVLAVASSSTMMTFLFVYYSLKTCLVSLALLVLFFLLARWARAIDAESVMTHERTGQENTERVPV
jgi:membrane protein implicated in regulation of membrane protease activity